MSRGSGTLCAVVLAFSLLGCRSDEDRCETLCDWYDKCGGGDACSDDDIDDCVDELGDAADDCYEAFDELADCIDDNDVDCDEVADDCVGEALEFADECGDDSGLPAR